MFRSIQFKKFNKSVHNLLLKSFSNDLEDPIFKRVTINYVKISRNRKFATVYLDLINQERKEEILSKLNRLNFFFKKSLSQYMDWYKIPFFKFVDDKTFENARKVENLLLNEKVKDVS